MTTTEIPPEVLQEQAREAYRRSVAEGRPLTRQQLGALFERSESWARDRIAEVRRADNSGDSPEGDTDSGPDNPGDTAAVAVAVELPPAAPVAVAEQPPAAVVDSPDMTPPAGDMTPADTPARSHRGARFVAWFGFAFGSLVSVAANWLAAWLPAADMPDGWSPSVASQVGAAVWPVALLVSVEVLSRTAWRTGRAWLIVRFAGVAVVALGSGVISYGHIHDVLSSWGYGPLGAGVGPLVIDGLMVVSGFALLAMSSTTTRKV